MTTYLIHLSFSLFFCWTVHPVQGINMLLEDASKISNHSQNLQNHNVNNNNKDNNNLHLCTSEPLCMGQFARYHCMQHEQTLTLTHFLQRRISETLAYILFTFWREILFDVGGADGSSSERRDVGCAIDVSGLRLCTSRHLFMFDNDISYYYIGLST